MSIDDYIIILIINIFIHHDIKQMTGNVHVFITQCRYYMGRKDIGDYESIKISVQEFDGT